MLWNIFIFYISLQFISSKPAVVIGCSKNEELLQLTENGSKLNDITNGKLTSLLEL